MQSFSYNIDKEITDMRNLFQSKNKESQRGSVVIEFALVLPLLLILFAGITEFGIAYYNKQVITNASREGARFGIYVWTETGEVESIVRNYIFPKDENGDEKFRLIAFGSYSDPVVNSEHLVKNGSEYLRVKVDFEYDYLIFSVIINTFNNIFNAGFGSTIEIGSSTTMRII